MYRTDTDVAIIGTGIVGIATAYYLAVNHGVSDTVLVDRDQPMALTSAQSGENYRNWWPHPTMVAFTDRSIDLLEDLARATDNRFTMTRRGYALATRSIDLDTLVDQLRIGLGDRADRPLRFHDSGRAPSYTRATKADWQAAPDGVDVLRNRDLIRAAFPSYAEDIASVIHIRRGGDISGQQLGMAMLELLKDRGARRIVGHVDGIARGSAFEIDLTTADGQTRLHAGRIVNAAGPFAPEIARSLGVELPIHNILQQKIAFEDRERTIPRDMPFSIDLDGQSLDWSPDERAALLEDADLRWLAGTLPGSIHSRPDGGDRGSWIKLGWAYNRTAASAAWEPDLDDAFPEIVLRGAARLNPSLKTYYGRLPRGMHHYGGWYTLTEENWPLIGPMGPAGAFMNCAYSGFGTMAACAGGELCAAWIAGADLPGYARHFSLDRYDDPNLMSTLLEAKRGIL